MINYQILTGKLLQMKQNAYLLKEFKKLETFDLSYFIGKKFFEDDDTQNYFNQ